MGKKQPTTLRTRRGGRHRGLLLRRRRRIDNRKTVGVADPNPTPPASTPARRQRTTSPHRGGG
eukprot:7092447-Lingulodinium_polyedra.AAC.1